MIAFPKEAIRAFETGDLISLGNNQYAVAWGPDTVLSVQPDGRYETRPKNAIGAWETATCSGNVLIYRPVQGAVFLVPIVEGV